MKRKQGELLGYSGKVPGGDPVKPKKGSQEIQNMINTLSELPSGHLPKALYPTKQKT